MKFFFKNQKKNLKKHLADLKKANIIQYERKELKYKISQQILGFSFSNCPFNQLLNYKIFPSNILCAYSQWIDENRTIQSGDTIVQQINIPPFTHCSQRLIVGVRVKEIFNTDTCKGFSYETLEGHVEKGISNFKIEQIKNNVYFIIETYSCPAIPLLKIFSPLSSWYQDFCTNEALKNVSRSS